MSTNKTNTKVGPSQAIQIGNYASNEQCSGWLGQVLENSQELVTRFEYIHTYGNAWYLDIEEGLLHHYHAKARHTNSLLKSLPELLPILTSCSQLLEAPDGSTGLPARSRSTNLGPYWADAGVILMMQGYEGQVHADFEGLAPYPALLFDNDTRAYSAVLTLATGASGGNLQLWKKHQLANQEPELDDNTLQELEYQIGTLSIFDSFCYHRIMASTLDDEHRFRAVAAIHFVYLEKPYPHWEYWF